METKTSVENKDIELNDLLIVSSSPHLRSTDSTQRIMLDVVIALIPALIASVYFFGMRSLLVVIVSVIAAVGSEYVFEKITKRPITVSDLSAVVTGVLVAFNVPVGMPFWQVIIGSMFAIIIVKQLFGGIGSNFMNPALAARAFILASWPGDMTTYVLPFSADGVSTATPLSGNFSASVMDLFIGNIPGVIGEVSKLALLIGAAYLLIRKVITWRIPVIYIASTAIFLVLFGAGTENILAQILSGGLILGAFFMANDYSSSPINPKAQIVYAIGCGLVTALIRCFGGYPEGVSYSILLMNVATPLIERFFKPTVFGVVGGTKNE